MKKSILCIIAAGAIVVLAYGSFLWWTFVDDVVTEGSAYGLTIGDTKIETFNKLPSGVLETMGSNAKVFIEIVVTDDTTSHFGVDTGHSVLVQTYLHDRSFDILNDRDSWEFFFDASFFDKLVLTFRDGRLVKISRQKKYFEGP